MSENNYIQFNKMIKNTIQETINGLLVSKFLFCHSNEKLKPLILSGASGAGKGTLFNMLKQKNPTLFELSISFTTRQPRQGEQHGREYYFVTKEDFQKEIDKNQFLEHCRVHDNFYGTHQQQVFNIIDQNKICVLDIDIQGAEKVHKKFPLWNYVFINTPSKQILEQRLRNRGTETEEQIQKRLKNADIEIAQKDKLGFYHNIVNDTREQAYNDLLSYLHKKYPNTKIN